MLVSWMYLRPKYHWTQILVSIALMFLTVGLTICQGVLICIGGLGLLVVSDFVTDKNYPALDRAKGDGFMIAGATLYGFSTFDSIFNLPNPLMDIISANATEEFFVRKRPLYEVVGQLGMWGFIINGIQASGMEWRDMKQVPWNGGISEPFMRLFFLDFIEHRYHNIVGLLMAYTAAMVILYTIAPMLYRLASAAFFNLSLLSSDFFGLLFGGFIESPEICPHN